MRRRDVLLATALVSLIAAPALLRAQQPAPWPAPPAAQQQWPDPPDAQGQPPAAPKAAKKSRKKVAPPPETDPAFEQDAPDDAAAPPPAPKAAKKARKKTPAFRPDPAVEREPADAVAAPAPAPKGARQPTMNILCDGPLGKNASHDGLAKAFGARNVVAQGVPPAGGSTVIFPNDPKRRLEINWRDASGRRRPATIVVEGASTWRARGFRIGDPLANVEKVNGRPFRLAGFSGENGGAARDWQGGKLDKLSGGCQLGMRFGPGPNAGGGAAALASGEFMSNAAEVKAASPVIVELVVGYGE
jgi:hypothetical protein